ncbi:unnamed protein product [Discula destructiva]
MAQHRQGFKAEEPAAESYRSAGAHEQIIQSVLSRPPVARQSTLTPPCSPPTLCHSVVTSWYRNTAGLPELVFWIPGLFLEDEMAGSQRWPGLDWAELSGGDGMARSTCFSWGCAAWVC